jgi:peroxiredoxin
MDSKRSLPVKLILSAAVAAIAAAAAWFAFQREDRAPDATFVSIKGEKLTTAALRGKVVLVNFWATSCTTCVHEMPMLVETYKKYAPRGYETIAVAMSYDPPNYVLNFAQTRALPFKVALDPVGELAQRFGNVKLTPTTFILDKHGNIAKRYVGEPSESELHALIEQLLAAG